MFGDPPPATIGRALERQRLEHRARRVERVRHALDERLAERRARGHVPEGLHEAVRDFQQDLRDVRQQLKRPAHP